MLHLKDHKDIVFHEYAITPLVSIYDENQKVSPYLTMGELFKATKVLDKNELHIHGIPLHRNATALHTLVREALGKALFVGSAYRSFEHEIQQGRNGTSQHTKALAIDFNGIGLVELIETAIKEENDLYKSMRQLGVNAFGLYNWGVHFDFRPAKPSGAIYFWDSQKKNMN